MFILAPLLFPLAPQWPPHFFNSRIATAHVNTSCKVIFILFDTFKLLMHLSLQKTDLTRFFIIKHRYAGRPKKQILVKKLSGSPVGTCSKMLTIP